MRLPYKANVKIFQTSILKFTFAVRNRFKRFFNFLKPTFLSVTKS
jgi:hypothetical protein